MKRNSILLLIVLILLTGSLTAEYLQKGTDDLNTAVRQSGDLSEKFPVIIVMKDQYDSDILYSDVLSMDKRTRREYTINTLKSFSDHSQSAIRKELQILENDGLVKKLRFLWIANVIGLYADREALSKLDSRTDIDRIEYDPFRRVLIDSTTEVIQENERGQETDSSGIVTAGLHRETREITYNVNIMNVPDVWDLGYYGQGVTVAVLDSGINYNHFDITNQMWNHPDYPNHGYNFVHNNHQTMDYHSHGTHCAGTVAGDGTSGSQTGVAPQCSVMSLLVLDASGNGQQSGVWEAIQFSADYNADIMSISLGWLHAWNPDRMTWRTVMQNALSAGVIASVAAGNEGNQQGSYPIPSNVRTPGDCPPPWMHPDQTVTGGLSAVMSIGATDSNDQIANFSSRGPVTWQNTGLFDDYPYNPGMGLIRPDVVAPGVSVKSLSHNNNSGYTFKSGTSMATPGNAGVLALMLSKNPHLLPEQLAQIIEESALPMSPSKNNTFGSGRVDALAAIENVPPNTASLPFPEDGEVDVVLFPLLNWTPGGGETHFQVSLGTDDPPTNILENHLIEATSYLVTEPLEPSTTYFWRIDTMSNNLITEGNVWSFTTTPLAISEDFETGDFSQNEWMFQAVGTDAQDWYVTSDESHSGLYSARSGSIGNDSFTSLYITMHIEEAGAVSFYRKISTEQNSDYLRFFINESSVGQWSGELDWALESYYLQPGIYTFRWFYMKDAQNNAGEDAVWIDNITFPPYSSVIVSPDNLNYQIQIEHVHLYWDLPVNRNGFIGFNIYRAIDQNDQYVVVNSQPVPDNEYQVPLTSGGEHFYYVTAVYNAGESAPSNSVNLTILPAPDNPVVEPEGGEYEESVTVSIIVDDPVVLLFYTLDGTEPTSEAELYEEPLTITESLTLKVKSLKEGHLPGDVIVNEYIITTSVEEEFFVYPTDLKVYPNPFILNSPALRNSQVLNIDFSLMSETEPVNINIYNIKGQLIRTLSPRMNGSHSYSISWDLKNHSGGICGSGIYLIRLVSDKEIITRRVMIIK